MTTSRDGKASMVDSYSEGWSSRQLAGYSERKKSLTRNAFGEECQRLICRVSAVVSLTEVSNKNRRPSAIYGADRSASVNSGTLGADYGQRLFSLQSPIAPFRASDPFAWGIIWGMLKIYIIFHMHKRTPSPPLQPSIITNGFWTEEGGNAFRGVNAFGVERCA